MFRGGSAPRIVPYDLFDRWNTTRYSFDQDAIRGRRKRLALAPTRIWARYHPGGEF
jgi:hypothetical protein